MYNGTILQSLIARKLQMHVLAVSACHIMRGDQFGKCVCGAEGGTLRMGCDIMDDGESGVPE